MSSSGKKKTTMAKMARESRMRERRLDKAARKDARKRNAAQAEYQPYGPPAQTVEVDERADTSDPTS